MPSDLFGDRGADISACGHYRYLLWRRWSSAPHVVFVMLNPSTADETFDDQTIRRCMGYARAWGAGAIKVVNLYPWRATDPRELERVGVFALGDPDATVDLNDRAIRTAIEGAERIVVAWGADPGPFASQRSRVLELLRTAGCPIVALALTKRGHPRHPSRLRRDVQPLPYPPEEAS